MDPTKNFDHLDPKLKETYARVMGTTTAGTGNAAQNQVGPPVSPLVGATPGVNPQNFNQPPTATPMDQPSALPNQNTEPNPGTGPTISSIPQTTSTVVPPMAQAQSAPNMNPTAATSSFFSNPSPAASDPTQNPVPPGGDYNQNTQAMPPADPNQAPVNPYSPDAQMQNSMPAEQMSQPLQSPAAVAQKSPHETSALLRVLYIVGGVIFFAIYTVFWIKVF